MPRINLYKISKSVEFLKKLDELEYESVDSDDKYDSMGGGSYSFKLFWKNPEEDSNLNWAWIFKEFGVEDKVKDNLIIKPKIKAIILVKFYEKNQKDFSDLFAVSFGFAYHDITNYSTNDWVFEFASKLNFSSIRQVSLIRPGSKNNKRTNIFVNYNNFNFNKGDLLSNFSAYFNDEDSEIFNEFPDFELSFNGRIDAGNSLKVNINKNNMACIIKLIDFINYFLKNNDEIKIKTKNEFPLSSVVEDEDILTDLNNLLFKNLKNYSNNSSENLEVSKYFYEDAHTQFDEDTMFYLENSKEKLEDINAMLVSEYIKSHEINSIEWSNIQINIENNGNLIKKDLSKFIYFNPIDSNYSEYFFMRGIWNKYDDYYLSRMKKDIKKLNVTEDVSYNFLKEKFEDYVNKQKEKIDADNKNKSDRLNRYKECFTEDVFINFLASDVEGYEMFHKEMYSFNGAKLEVMDLFNEKEETAYFLKVGNASSKFNYVVDQCLDSIDALMSDNLETKSEKGKKLPPLSKIKNFCLWLIFERESKFSVEDGNVDLNDYRGFSFKQKLLYWDSQVRLRGFNPQIIVSYKQKKELNKKYGTNFKLNKNN